MNDRMWYVVGYKWKLGNGRKESWKIMGEDVFHLLT